MMTSISVQWQRPCAPLPLVAALLDSSIKALFALFIKISVSINICLIILVI
jgi:hypothetical protein